MTEVVDPDPDIVHGLDGRACIHALPCYRQASLPSLRVDVDRLLDRRTTLSTAQSPSLSNGMVIALALSMSSAQHASA